MFGSVILEVAIGVIFFYLLLSLLCTAVNEVVASLLSLRARTLEAGIRTMLQDPDARKLAQRFYEHPLISGLGQQVSLNLKKIDTPGRPSYIRPEIFSRVLLDLFANPDIGGEPQLLTDARAAVKELRNKGLISDELQRSMLLLVDEAGNDQSKLKDGLERWFNDTMERTSGWYKRRTQTIVFAVAVVVVALLNADTISIANTLWRDTDLRLSMVRSAEQLQQPAEAAEKAEPGAPGEAKAVGEAAKRVADAGASLGSLGLPIGWGTTPDTEPPDNFWGWVGKLLGMLMSVMAASLGAPFWFDILNKVFALRAAGRRIPLTAKDS